MKRMPIVLAATAAGLATVLGFHTQKMNSNVLSGLSGASGAGTTPTSFAIRCRQRDLDDDRGRVFDDAGLYLDLDDDPRPGPAPRSAQMCSTATGSWSSR